LANKDRDGAMRQIEEILKEAPAMTGKYCALAASLLQQNGQLDLAVRLYQDAIAFDPDDTAARLYLGIALQSM
jgi:Tfp pilus assembly protein PilF